ncbi:MAG: hypothetical protein IGS03_19255 [Candidatus Sericytochromatia bacterium]|nr:hypothetical protein [Candidatus Sericytochromatia bacterium]
MTNEVQYQFGLRIGDKEIQLGGDKIFVETQMEKWLQLFAKDLPADLQPGGNIPAATRAEAGAAPAQRRPPTLVEFIKTKEPKEITDMILVIGLYMERFQQKNLFTRTDLWQTQIFHRLGKSEEEVQQALVDLVNKQLLADSETMGASELSYALTFTGEQVVKEGFNH